jgi:hypothetical protein
MPQITIEQHIAAVKNVDPSFRPQRLVEAAYRRQGRALYAGSHYHRRDKNMNPVHNSRVHEMGYGRGAALHQNFSETSLK